MSPHQQAEAITTDPVLVELITTAIQAASNEQLERGRKRTAEAQAALQAALEDLAQVKQERDGLAATLAESKKHAKAAKVFAHQVAGSPHTSIGESDRFDDLVLSLEKWSIGINVQTILAAHNRKVAAGVLRDAEGHVVDPVECSTLLYMAGEYEAGTREVPNAD